MWVSDFRFILAAMLLDMLLGDPRRLPHLTRFTGTSIIFWEGRFRAWKFDGLMGGGCFYLVVLGSVLIPVYLLYLVADGFSPFAGGAVEIFVIYQCVAYRDLMKHVQAVLSLLKSGNIEEARERVAWIVGRDTNNLDETGISRATIETLAESSNDGVFAPLFWAGLLGPAGALIFRVTNTLDSMVGHRDDRYEKFGKASARLDDVLGFLPARLSAFLLWLARPCPFLWRIFKDASKHASPNAGWPEAVTAYCLGIRLGGENHYGGKLYSGPILNLYGDPPTPRHLQNAITQCSWAFFIFTLGLMLLHVILHQ